jgi:hypothetical protein
VLQKFEPEYLGSILVHKENAEVVLNNTKNALNNIPSLGIIEIEKLLGIGWSKYQSLSIK